MGDFQIRSRTISNFYLFQDLKEGSSSADDPDNYKFEENVKSWTDFMYSRYHPRSINVLQDFRVSDSENEFDTFTNGRETWTRNNFNEDFLDKARLYLEECNSCQGFQALFDCTDGFSGLTVKCLEEMADEYGKTVFVVPIVPPRVHEFKNSDSPMSLTIRIVNLAMTYASLIENSSMFLPISTMAKGWRDLSSPREIPGISFIPDDYYQTSSILASYLDTISLRYRTTNNPNYLPGFCSDLSNHGRKLCGAGLGLPFQMNAKEDLIECLDRLTNTKLFTDLSPNTEIGPNRVVQTVCIRGVNKDRLKKPLRDAGNQMQMAAYRCESIEEMVQLFFQCQNHASMAHCCSVSTPMVTRVPFPLSMFDQRIAPNGFTFPDQFLMREEKEHVRSVPVFATAQNSNDLAETIGSLHREAERVKINKIYRFKETGLEADEYSEVLNQLLDFKDLYDEKYYL